MAPYVKPKALAARRKRHALKLEVLTYYSPHHKLRCSARGCKVKHIDMLTLDHVDNSGAEFRREHDRSSITVYRYVKRNNWPHGYKTLCWNHQAIKELRHRRDSSLLNQLEKDGFHYVECISEIDSDD